MRGRLLVTVEAILYVAFLADCLILVASVGRTADYYPAGGVSLIVILLLIGGVRRLRGERIDY